jgi:hypothetical protein
MAIGGFVLSAAGCAGTVSDDLGLLVEIVWILVLRIGECEAVFELIDLLFDLYRTFSLPMDNKLTGSVFSVLQMVVMLRLMDPNRESREDSEDEVILQGLKVFHFLWSNSHCSPRLALGMAFCRVYQYAAGGDESFEVQHLARRIFCDIVRTSLVETADLVHEGSVILLTCNFFRRMPSESGGDIDAMLASAHGLMVASQHALRTQVAAFIEAIFGVFEIAGAIAEWEELDDPRLLGAMTSFREVYGDFLDFGEA